MNILYVSQWFSPTGGGGEVLFMELAKGMSDQGHNVHVISHEINKLENQGHANLKVHRIKPFVEGFPPSYRQNIQFILGAIWLGLKIIRNEKIDIVHVNNFSPIIVGTILSKLCRVPLVKTFHVVFAATPNYWNNWSKQSNVSGLTSIIGPLFEKLTIRLPADIIHTVSNSTEKDLIDYKAKSKIIVIPNLVNVEYYNKWSEKKIQEKSVLFVGRLAFNKNLGVVISSFKKVVEKIPDAKLVVIGTGPMLDEWKKMALDTGLEQHIFFTEFIPEDQKMNFLNECSTLVLPSITEGLPTVALESFAMSKPVILSDIPPHQDIVEDGIDGFLVGVNDVRKWSEKMIYLLSNKDICKKMGDMGRIKVEKEFSNQVVLNKIESLYAELVK